jgi:translation initiation factor 3 subunit A
VIPLRPTDQALTLLELIAVGQNLAALQSLHEVITSKRSKSASLQSLEPIMLRLVELCVNLRKGKLAKEGLYQFKNIAQNTNVLSIEVYFPEFSCQLLTVPS